MAGKYRTYEKEASLSTNPDYSMGPAHRLNLLAIMRASLPVRFKQHVRRLTFYPFIRYKLANNYRYDKRRFVKNSSVAGAPFRRVQLLSWINADYHKIEKAIALPNPRPEFGAAVVSRLLENLEQFLKRYEAEHICAISLNVLTEYIEFNERHGVQNPQLKCRIDGLSKRYEKDVLLGHGGGTSLIKKEDIHRQSKIDLEGFFSARHSIRHFSGELVDRSLLAIAVNLAQKTPTVCNRQSLKVYGFDEPKQRAEVLNCQQGNSGFGHQISTALVVTSDVQTFFSVGERNQCWIDGGLFSMSLVYALHSLGLGSICLNWSVEKEVDQKLHRVAGIPDSEAVIMMIGVGHLPNEVRVAQSPRKPIDEVLVWGKAPRQ